MTLVYNEIIETISRAEARWPHSSQAELEGDIRLLAEDVANEHPEFTKMTAQDQNAFLEKLLSELTGYGPLTDYLADESISEIMVNGCDKIFIERQGVILAVSERFMNNNQLYRVIKKILSPLGRRVDELNPMVDARLPDGSRINVAIPPIAVDGPYVTIRKFAKQTFTLEQLVEANSMPSSVAELLAQAVKAKDTILISGGTGSGKTTLLNVLARLIPDGERIVTIEDAAELRLECSHVVRLEARPASPDGRGEITIRQLVRNALRMRPDRIIIGEVRGSETLDLIQALNTGHQGSMSTVHAENPLQALYRLETMALLAGHEIPLSIIRNQISGAVRYVVQLERLSTGERVVARVTEICGTTRGEYVLKDHYQLKAAA
ncbi:MAG: CpaF family protein [Firmicutes bacterium]|nr:CpaF family protein [Bacillota bacterium]